MPYSSSMFGASTDLTNNCARSRGLTHCPRSRCRVSGSSLRQSAKLVMLRSRGAQIRIWTTSSLRGRSSARTSPTVGPPATPEA